MTRDGIVGRTTERFELLARSMLRGHTGAGARDPAANDIRAARDRLARALGEPGPGPARDFYRRAAEEMRTGLLDLLIEAARRPGPTPDAGASGPGPPDPADPARWAVILAAVAGLPAGEREAFDLAHFHGLPRADVAVVLGVTEREAQRRCAAATRRLRQAGAGPAG